MDEATYPTLAPKDQPLWNGMKGRTDEEFRQLGLPRRDFGPRVEGDYDT